MTLRWNKPTDDGGRPITHFIIQKKDKFGGWFDALITDDDNCMATIDELEARVPGLSEGKWYQFRIVAVNKAGESWPSYETKPHLARHKNCMVLKFSTSHEVSFLISVAPTIDKGAGGSKSVKVNRMTVWRINVKGEPPPVFSWWKNGQQISNSEEFQVESEEYQGGSTAILQIFKTQMQDAGTYTLRGENRNGSDRIDLDLVVLDTSHDIECEMLRNANLECRCSQSFRLDYAFNIFYLHLIV